MGLFHRNESGGITDDGNRNISEAIRRENDVDYLIRLDPIRDFNTNSIITIAPNEMGIFIKNGQFYGTLGPGRHEIKNENIPILRRIRDALTGGQTTFTCELYHVETTKRVRVQWGTSQPIIVLDHLLGGDKLGLKKDVRASAVFTIRFNIREDSEAPKHSFMELMGNKSFLTVEDVSIMIHPIVSKKAGSLIGSYLEDISYTRPIDGVSQRLEEFSEALKPSFVPIFEDLGFEILDLSMNSISIELNEQDKKRFESISQTEANVYEARQRAENSEYANVINAQIMKDAVNNPNAGGMAGAGIGMGMGMGMGMAFSQMAAGLMGGPNGQTAPAQQPSTPVAPQPDPMESLMKMKKMLDAGLINQQQYDAKVNEIMSRM